MLPVNDSSELKTLDYDDSPWTREELEAIAWDTANRMGLEDWDDNTADVMKHDVPAMNPSSGDKIRAQK